MVEEDVKLIHTSSSDNRANNDVIVYEPLQQIEEIEREHNFLRARTNRNLKTDIFEFNLPYEEAIKST